MAIDLAKDIFKLEHKNQPNDVTAWSSPL